MWQNFVFLVISKYYDVVHNWFISLFSHIALDNLFGSICKKFTMIIHWRIMETEYKSFKTLERFEEKSLNHVLQGVPINMGIQWRIRYRLFKWFLDLVKWYLLRKLWSVKFSSAMFIVCLFMFWLHTVVLSKTRKLQYTNRVNLSVFTVHRTETL